MRTEDESKRRIPNPASVLGAMALAENFRRTGRLEIPSLNMAIICTPGGKTTMIPLDDTIAEHPLEGLAQGAARPNSTRKIGTAPRWLDKYHFIY